MSNQIETGLHPPSQGLTAGRRVAPTNPFIEFRKEEIEQSIASRFEQMVCQYPDRIAVKTRTDTLTYRELNQAANRLAHFLLRQRGHEPEPVALLVDYDAPTIAAILGILKAGKICVPFDPSHPETRAAYILGHSQARVIVSSNKKLSSSTRIPMNVQQLISLDEIDTQLPAENVGLKVSPDIFAFILYTSGSTGKPKGVIQNHRNILHWTLRTTNGFHIGADDRVSLLASLGGGQAVATAFIGPKRRRRTRLSHRRPGSYASGWMS